MDWFIQQLVNGLALGSIYALIALGYTMVYGVLRFINFAHSDVLMLGHSLRSTSPVHRADARAAVDRDRAHRHRGVRADLRVHRYAHRVPCVPPARKRPRLTVLITPSVYRSCSSSRAAREGFWAATKPFPSLLRRAELGSGAIHVSSNDVVVLVLTRCCSD
jgi:branched-chain amino acid transport system permease protein